MPTSVSWRIRQLQERKAILLHCGGQESAFAGCYLAPPVAPSLEDVSIGVYQRWGLLGSIAIGVYQPAVNVPNSKKASCITTCFSFSAQINR